MTIKLKGERRVHHDDQDSGRKAHKSARAGACHFVHKYPDLDRCFRVDGFVQAVDAVEKLASVTNVTTDMDAHTLTLSFDDEEQTLEAVVEALAEAGYVAKDPQKLTQ